MPDFSYITRAMLGLGTPSNFKYDGAFAASVHSESSASASIYHAVGDPSHIFLRSSTTPLTDLYLPGYTNSQGVLVDGLTFYVKNTAPKGSSAGYNYSIKVRGTNSGGAFIMVTLYEQDGCHVVYNNGDSTWYIISHLDTW